MRHLTFVALLTVAMTTACNGNKNEKTLEQELVEVKKAKTKEAREFTKKIHMGAKVYYQKQKGEPPKSAAQLATEDLDDAKKQVLGDLDKLCTAAKEMLANGASGKLLAMKLENKVSLKSPEMSQALAAVVPAPAEMIYPMLQNAAGEAAHVKWECPELDELRKKAE